MTHLLSPAGRISGTQFFSFIAAVMMAMVIIGFGLGTVPVLDAPLILSGLWLLLAWPMACACIRRLHDTGRSAIWLWMFAPQVAVAIVSLFVGGFLPGLILWLMTALGITANLLCWGLIFFLALKTGDEGDNAYGPDPHGSRDEIAAGRT